MPRPRKWKKVCCLPENNLYGPLNGPAINSQIIIMTVEEYETIRLIDLEGLTQEECAERMQVARATVQKIYNDARNKLAESLVNGNILKIEGGDYKLYDESEQIYGCRRCRRQRCGKKLNKFKEDTNENRNACR
jgi:Predicted DNA-binding proteins